MTTTISQAARRASAFGAIGTVAFAALAVFGRSPASSVVTATR